MQELADELASFNGHVPGEKEFQDAKKVFEQSQAQQHEAERLLKDAELQLAGVELEKKRIQEKLFSGTISNPKELSQFEKELEQIDKKRGKLDEQILTKMDHFERLNEACREKQALLEKAKVQFEETGVVSNQRKEALAQQLQEAKERYQSSLQTVEPDLVETYRGLKDRKNGIAVVKIKGNNCMGCFMVVPEKVIQKVKAYELVFCSSCGRILVA